MLAMTAPSSMVQNGITATCSGCFISFSPAAQTPDKMIMQQNATNIFRWRAGNLASRQASGTWIRSVHSPVDNIRPIRVQNVAVFDGDEFQTLPPGLPTTEMMATVWQ